MEATMPRHILIRNVLLAATLITGVCAAKSNTPVLTTDDAISQRAVHEVRMYPRYSLFDNVEIQVSNGALHLTGEVTQPYKKSDLGHIMGRIAGVTAVDNDLKVAPPLPFDDQLRSQVARALFHDPVLARYEDQPIPAIHIIVDHGHVSLEGVVRTVQDKDLAGIRANQNMGFGNATNNLRVEIASPHS